MKLLLCYPASDDHLAQIRRTAPDWEIICSDQQTVHALLGDCDVFCGHARTMADWESVVGQGRLQWIQSSAAGLDHCLVPAVVQSPVVVTSCSGLFRDSVAEQTMALLFGLARRLPVFFQAQQQRQYERQPTGDVHGKSYGIVGFGGNGQRIAELVRPFARRILATDLFPEAWLETPGVPRVDRLMPATDLDELLCESDVLISTIPLDESTHKLFGMREFQLLPRGAWFINVGRGKTVDETALCQALASGHLGGAGLDVAYTEPLPADCALWDAPNTIITPHVGAQSTERYQLVTDLLCANVRRYLAGHRLINLVDKAAGLPLPADRYQRDLH